MSHPPCLGMGASGSHSLEKPEACPSCKGCSSGGRERGGTKLIMWFFSEMLRKSIRGRDRLGVFTEGLCLSSYGCCDNLSQIYWLQPTNTVVLNFWRSENWMCVAFLGQPQEPHFCGHLLWEAFPQLLKVATSALNGIL